MPRKREPLKTFPRRLRMAMTAKQMTSADLMRCTKLGSGQVSEYLNGHSEPKITSLCAICSGLGVSADFLLGLSDSMKIKNQRKTGDQFD